MGCACQLYSNKENNDDADDYLEHIVGFVHWFYIHSNFMSIHQENVQFNVRRKLELALLQHTVIKVMSTMWKLTYVNPFTEYFMPFASNSKDGSLKGNALATIHAVTIPLYTRYGSISINAHHFDMLPKNQHGFMGSCNKYQPKTRSEGEK